MRDKENYNDTILKAWQINNRVTVFLIENLPEEVWHMKIPGMPRKTIGMIAAHIHNVRCMWIKMLGKKYDIQVPQKVDRHKITGNQLITALEYSNLGMIRLFKAVIKNGGKLQGAPFQNFSPDIVHLLAHFTTHEGHHRGQIVMLARQLGHRLPEEVTAGLWQWTERVKEVTTPY